MLKLVASNYTLDGVSLCPQYRKPFDIIAKGLSRPNWLPEQDSVTTVETFCFSLRNLPFGFLPQQIHSILILIDFVKKIGLRKQVLLSWLETNA